MRILITGSRDFTDIKKVAGAIAGQVGIYGSDHTIIHGAARGADALAAKVGENWGYTVEAHPADWNQYGKAAGMIRNREMLDSGVDICLAFYKRSARNVGTRGMVRLARRAGVEVREYWED